MALAGTFLTLHRIQSSPLVVLEAVLVKRISGCVKFMTPQRVAQKTFDSSFPVMALNRSGNANDRKYPKPKEDIRIKWPTVLQELLG